MPTKMPYNLDKARNFLDKTKSYGIVFDKDADGICSAVLVAKYLKSKGIEAELAQAKDETGINVSSGLLDQMNALGTLITCDLPLEQSPIVNVLTTKRVLVVDHHSPEADLNNKTWIHINPRFEDPKVYRPTSYLTYVMTLPFAEKYVWISGVGILSDYGLKDCKDVIAVVAKKYPQLVKKDPYEQKEMWDSGLGMISAIITATYGIKNYTGSTKAFHVLLEAETPEDVTSSELMRYYDEYQGALEKEMDNFRHEAVRHEKMNAYTYQVKSKYKLMSVLATRVSETHEDSIVLLYRETASHVELSSRCQSGRVNVAEMMHELTKGIGSGGGHPKSAGGEVAIEHKEEFYERMRRKFEGL